MDAFGTSAPVNRIITVLKESYHVLFSITYFVKHFNISRTEIISSSEKPTVTGWKSWRNGVCIAASGIRSWVAQRVVRYVDVMISSASTKSWSVGGAVIHCVLLISILSQFDRIVSIFVVKREQESFTGISITARTWIGNKSLTLSKHFGRKGKQK